MARKVVQINPEHAKARYSQALLSGDFGAASVTVSDLIAAKVALAEIYVDVMAPAMVTIGELWCEGKINVAQEHLGTQITLGQMEKLRLMQPVPRPLPYSTVVACVEGEAHFVGARMAADLFQLEGWSVDFLGPDVPTRALIEIVASRRPDLLCLSVTLESNRKAVDVLIKGLKTIPESPKVILGGCFEENGRDWKHGLDGVESAMNVVDGVRLARKLFKPSRSQVDLSEYLKELGQRIRSLRQKIGWTQEELAKATKLTRSYLVAVEGGKQNLTMGVVVRIANALNLSPDQLIGRGE